MGVSDVPEDRVLAWVEASCEEQGVAVRVTDTVTLHKVVALLGGSVDSPRAQARSASTRTPSARSQPPAGIDPVDVEDAASLGAGLDDGVVQNGLHDGCLPVEVELGPLEP